MSQEAMKLALEALEGCEDVTADVLKAITALREALAEQKSGIKQVIELYDSPDQPSQQEPVAWKNAALRVGEDLCSVGPFGYYDMTAEQWLDWALSVVTVHAPPPQRTWVGLTESEITTSLPYSVTRDKGCFHAGALWAEAKLKEKNNA